MGTAQRNRVVLGAGPVGRAVIAELASRGLKPKVVTRRGADVPNAMTEAVDLTNLEAAELAVAGADVVYQCAQPEYHRWPAEFPPLQRNVIRACEAANARLVIVENMYGYGPVDGPLTETTPLAATTRKGRVRAQMWNELLEAHQAGRVQTMAVRASDFFGPGVAGSAFGERFFPAIVEGKKVQVLGDPDRLHSVTFVPDLARTMVALSELDDAFGHAWHAPNAAATTVTELVARTAHVAGTEPKIQRVARWQLHLLGMFVKPVKETIELLYEFEHDFVVDDSAVRTEFGVTNTPLDVAIAATISQSLTATP